MLCINVFNLNMKRNMSFAVLLQRASLASASEMLLLCGFQKRLEHGNHQGSRVPKPMRSTLSRYHAARAKSKVSMESIESTWAMELLSMSSKRFSKRRPRPALSNSAMRPAPMDKATGGDRQAKAFVLEEAPESETNLEAKAQQKQSKSEAKAKQKHHKKVF